MLKVDEAIRIAKIIEYCPADRLPLIMDVFKQANIDVTSLESVARETLDGVDEIDTIKAEDYLENLKNDYDFEEYKDGDGAYRIPCVEFNSICQVSGINSPWFRSTLAKMGLLQVSTDGGRRKYSVPTRIDGKLVRCVVLRMDPPQPEEERRDLTDDSKTTNATKETSDTTTKWEPSRWEF